VLVLCILWRDRKITRRDLLTILPHAVIGLAAALLTIRFQARAQHYGLIPDTLDYRVARAGMAIWYYLAALVWPAGVSPMRPQWAQSLRTPLAWLPAIAAVAAPAIFYWKRRTWGRPLLFAYGYYIVMLLPVLGFVWMALMQETPSADWWQYMAAPGMFALAGAAIVTGMQKSRYVPAAFGMAIGLLWVRTEVRETIYQSMETYCRAVIAEVPHAWTLQMNLGIMLKRHGDFAGAEACYRQAIADNPRYVEAHINLANALGATGNVPGADRELRLALAMRPGDPVILESLASVCANEGRADDALDFETQAVQADPGNRWLLRSLAVLDERAGRYAHAAASYQQAIALSPNDLGSVAIRLDLCKVLSEAGKQQDALAICDLLVRMAHQNGDPATIAFAEGYRAECQSRPDGVFPGSEALNRR
jgi:Flp pilus assembly protein TadD